MAWIESHQDLERHPKVHVLMQLMGWDIAYGEVALDITIGKLHRFWWWCLSYAPTGDLRGKNDSVLAGSVGLAPADGRRFVEAMAQSCWIDRVGETFRVHDWADYAGRYLRESKFKNHPEKQEELDNLYPRTIRGSSKVPTNLTNQPTNSPAGAGGGGKPRKPKSAREPPAETPEFRQLTDHWLAKHPLYSGASAMKFGRLEGVTMAELWDKVGHSLGWAKAAINAFLADRSALYEGHSVKLFKLHMDKFIARSQSRNGQMPPRPAAVREDS